MEELEQAQLITSYLITGKSYQRFPHPEFWTRLQRELAAQGSSIDMGVDLTQIPCTDCGAQIGQLHLPGCDQESCPACGKQAISCDCQHDEGSELKTKPERTHKGMEQVSLEHKALIDAAMEQGRPQAEIEKLRKDYSNAMTARAFSGVMIAKNGPFRGLPGPSIPLQKD